MRFLVFVFAILFVPMLLIQQLYPGSAGNVLELFLAASAPALLLYALLILLSKMHIGLAIVFVAALAIVSLLTRVSYGFLQDFTGMGYTIEFFAHAEWKSVKIAFSEYGFASIPIALFVALSIWLFSILGRTLHQKSILEGALALALSGVFIFLGSNSAPEVLFAKGYQQFVNAGEVTSLSDEDVRSSASSVLEPLRPSRPLPKEKALIRATAPEQPYNVVIVYLESFNENLTENKVYPGLTPNIDAMKQAYYTFPYNFSSGYVTIEGIFNSQCGTLVNMAYSNSSLKKAGARMPKLPCMGDVLRKAGYTQIYLGGADLSFAGKGDYLLDHGYDQVLGLTHWIDQGFKKVKNAWGLPDTQLFEEAFKQIEVLHAKPEPFNVTLLTLGTHVPGYPYEGCPDYPQSDERFIDAIHCTDFLLNKFVRQLDASGILEDTIVYVQADHGVFSSRDMFRLFDKEGVTDKRLFTMAIVPDKRKKTIEYWNTQAQMSSLDMVANILDLLEIEHDADFVLARSHINRKNKPRYELTRYVDYNAQGKAVANRPQDCAASELAQMPVTIPLNSCDKRRAIHAVYTLGSTYADKPADNMVCDLSAETYLDPRTDIFHLRWGTENLTGNFYGEGRAVLKRKGVFAVILDEEDQIVQQLFFSSGFKKTLNNLRRTLRGLDPGQRVILATNTQLENVEDSLKPFWPEELLRTRFVYMTKTAAGFEIEASLPDMDFSAIIRPASCEGGLQLTMIDHPLFSGESNFCEIEAWGPKIAHEGQSFNLQPNGNSAFWIKTECAPTEVAIVFDDKLIKTTRNLPLITGGLKAESYLSRPGKYDVKLYDPSTGDTQEVGQLHIKAKLW
jgi:phosphoglycerol transferase MdoB-like AlkP superfamily enzyme